MLDWWPINVVDYNWSTLLLVCLAGFVAGCVWIFLISRKEPSSLGWLRWKPRSVCRSLAGNRLRVKFAQTPPPKTSIERAWVKVLVKSPIEKDKSSILPRFSSWLVKSCRAHWRRKAMLADWRKRCASWTSRLLRIQRQWKSLSPCQARSSLCLSLSVCITTTLSFHLHLPLLYFANTYIVYVSGCTAFELSNRKRTDQDYKNLDAVYSCLRSIISHNQVHLPPPPQKKIRKRKEKKRDALHNSSMT